MAASIIRRLVGASCYASPFLSTTMTPHPLNGTNLSVMMANSLPFKGRVGVGMGVNVAKEPIPILAFPLKGKGR